MIVYLSIGNSDDKLTQAEWCSYNLEISTMVVSYATKIHGAWSSNPVGPFQNSAWCLEFSGAVANEAKNNAIEVRKKWRQDSVAWAIAETEFI
jgi:hypothetical protein